MNRMKNLLIFLVALSMILVWTGCEKEEEVNEFEELTEYLETDAPWNVNAGGWNIAAADVQADLDGYFIIDVRADTAYARGHVPGAYHTSMAGSPDYIDANNTGDLPVVVVCYTGQSAAYTVSLLKLLGYDAKSLLFGMSSWNGAFDSWSSKTSTAYSAQFETTAAPALPDNDYPELNTGYESGEEILEDRVAEVLAGGFKGIGASDVFASTGSYQTINNGVATDYNTYGHVPGALQVDPNSLSTDANLSALDPGETNVIYCWTGQTSALVTAYLRVLGYDALSLKFGANGMIFDDLAAHTWSASADYTYESD